MTHYCLDACSIINLFCGWEGIQELHTFGASWSTTTTALREFKEVRVRQADGTIIRSPIEHPLLLQQYPLAILSDLSDNELDTATNLSIEIDDGEAECLAVALHRNLVFVSDDALAIAAAESRGAQTVSSLDLISQWADLEPRRPALLFGILERIELLARYVPPRSHPRRGWWEKVRHARPG
ncbi:hypothetical protein FHW84_002564 [Dyella sp. SG562]|uniref:hypothetical protein n=1 Tax=Dyella sp. SG562 TaxID=2587017 RepID=UPI0014240A3D|nr:hypothetical protein [Dyella sp. SG562]NII73979.1 hypothetical protein [Dyella sp. SG562]